MVWEVIENGLNNVGSLVENERLVTKKMTKIRISMTTFCLAIAGGYFMVFYYETKIGHFILVIYSLLVGH